MSPESAIVDPTEHSQSTKPWTSLILGFDPMTSLAQTLLQDVLSKDAPWPLASDLNASQQPGWASSSTITRECGDLMLRPVPARIDDAMTTKGERAMAMLSGAGRCGVRGRLRLLMLRRPSAQRQAVKCGLHWMNDRSPSRLVNRILKWFECLVMCDNYHSSLGWCTP